MSKLFKYEKSYFNKERFFVRPLTITFYKNNEKILRIRDVTHFLSLENTLYLFGVGFKTETGKYIVTKDEFDYSICEINYNYNYQFCKNLVRDLRIGRTGKPLGKRIKKTFENYDIDFLPHRFRDWVVFILKHYNYERYFLEEILDLDETSPSYLTITMKLKERNTI